MRVKEQQFADSLTQGNASVVAPAAFSYSNARCRERLELPQRQPHGPVMCFKNPFVLAQESRDGNRLRWRESEVEEYPAIGRVLAAFRPRHVQPLRQHLAGRRMLILAQPEKIIRPDSAGYTETLRAEAKPLAGHPLAFIVVIPDAEMFFKVFPRICQVRRPWHPAMADNPRRRRSFAASGGSRACRNCSHRRKSSAASAAAWRRECCFSWFDVKPKVAGKAIVAQSENFLPLLPQRRRGPG